jgi:hypothetical protein
VHLRARARFGSDAGGEESDVTEPHAQDALTQEGAASGDPVLPPAPANQWTPHDGGIAPAPPPRNAAANALRRLAGWLRPRKATP